MISPVQDLLSSPAIAYLLLTVLAIEALVLYWVWREKKKGIPPVQVLTFLGSGAAFSFALWCVLAEANVFWLAICLVIAFIFHILDLKLRFRW